MEKREYDFIMTINTPWPLIQHIPRWIPTEKIRYILKIEWLDGPTSSEHEAARKLKAIIKVLYENNLYRKPRHAKLYEYLFR